MKKENFGSDNMENTSSRNSIILKNISSPYIEQAIFILKKEAEFEDDIVTEAQKIIDNFIKRRRKKSKVNKYIKKTFTALAVGGVMILSGLMIYFAILS